MMPTIEVIVENHYAPRCHPSQYAPEESTKPCQSVNQRVIRSELQITPRQVQEGSWSWKGLPGRKAGLSKNFSRPKLANTDICTGTDRRFMHLRAYKTPCNSLYERPEATIYSSHTTGLFTSATVLQGLLRLLSGLLICFFGEYGSRIK